MAPGEDPPSRRDPLTIALYVFFLGLIAVVIVMLVVTVVRP